MLARGIEAYGLATVVVTMMPVVSERAGVPRTLGVEHPFGQTMGPAGDRDRQRDVFAAALDVLRQAPGPGYVGYMHDSGWEWPDARRARRRWSPPEPSPIEAAMHAGEYVDVPPWDLGAKYLRPGST